MFTADRVQGLEVFFWGVQDLYLCSSALFQGIQGLFILLDQMLVYDPLIFQIWFHLFRLDILQASQLTFSFKFNLLDISGHPVPDAGQI